MADFDSITNILYFSIFDSETKKLKYSKWNFKFDLYSADYKLENLPKLDVFIHFLKENHTYYQEEPSYVDIKGDYVPSYLKPTVLKENLIKYFSPMTEEIIAYNDKYAMTTHPGYMNLQDPAEYASITTLVKNQFELKYYRMYELRRLQDFYYSDNDGVYSKYNFNFSKYSEYFKVYGNNLVVFTDFISRTVYSSGSYIGAYGYGVPYGFKKYFIKQPEQELINYMSLYGVTSIWKNVSYKNEHSINFVKYAEENKLSTDNLEYIKEHYYRWGQFKQIKIEFITNELTSVEKNINSICTISTTSQNATGFLYKNNDTDKNIYIVTCSHLVDKNNLSTIMASFGIKNNKRTNISTTAQFRIIGRDMFSDILVGVYDPLLPYNQTFKPDLSPYTAFRINLISDYKIGESIYTIGSIGLSDNNSLLKGDLIDPNYIGDFYPESTNIPESLLMDLRSIGGISGSPIFKEENDNEVIGMMIGTIKNGKYAIGITSFILDNLITNIIARWAVFSKIFINNPIKLQYYTKKAITKRWLGAVTSYFNPKYSGFNSPSLNSFPETGGIVIHDFYLGFNYIKNTFVFDTDSLLREGVTEIKGPLLKSKIYNKFIDSGKNPIVIKSMTFQSGLIGQYSKYELGKYSNQQGFNKFHYGFIEIGTKPTPDGYVNGLAGIYGKLYFEFYYFDGVEWVYDTDEIYGDGDDSYTNYTDSLGNKYYQNKFDYPTILLTYQNSYIHNLDNPSGYGNGIFSPLGEKSYGKSKVYIENSVSNLENVDITSMSDATQSWAQGDPTLPGNKQASAPTQSWANGEPTTPGNAPAFAST